MAKCPNCGQKTARTGDWACQWCGYPLLSGSYKKIPKTYQQLKEERLHYQESPVRVEAEPAPEPEPESEPEAVPELKAEPIPEPEVEPVPELKVEAILAPEPEPVAAPEPEARPLREMEPSPTALEVTVEEMLSAYAAEGVAADVKFVNKILRITGVVDRIEVKDVLDIHYITLTSAEKNRLQNVRCMFDRHYGAELNQLATGQTVTVQGQYDGSIINMRMRDCVLVR